MADAEKTLRDLLDKILDEKDYKPRKVDIEAISSGGANYTSAIFLVTVTSPNRDDLKLFAKVACVGEYMRSRMSADWLYSTERMVYTKLVKIYKDLQDELKVPDEDRFVFPKFYGCNSEMNKETIVMENLIESGYKSYNRFKSMDWEYACAGVENIAKFHALSFGFAKYYPEEFEKLTAGMKFRIGSEELDDVARDMWVKLVDRSLDLLNEEQRDIVRKFVFDPNIRFDTFNQPIGKPVIAHGDYRLSNLLFRRQNDKLQTITVDFQTVNAGNPVADLIYFFTLGSDEEFRQKYLDQLFDNYYTTLAQALKRLALNIDEEYPKEKFHRDIKELLPYSVLLGVMVLPVVMVEAESAPKVDGDANMNGFLVKSNELYAERFRGIVNDFIKLKSSTS